MNKATHLKTYFANKVIVITGGAGGLGQALTELLCGANANIALLDLSFPTEPIPVQASSASSILQIECDICQSEQVNQALQKIINLWGRIDVLINNAGIAHMSKFEDMDLALINKIMAVNFMGSVNVTHACLPHIKQQQGQIVAISSVAGFSPLYGRSAYAASKHAMEGFFSSLAAELKEHSVSVSIICPSFVATRPELTAAVNQGVSSPGAAKKNQVGQTLTPQQAAMAICQCIQNKRAKLYLGKISKLAKWLHTLCPRLYQQQMIKATQQEFD